MTLKIYKKLQIINSFIKDFKLIDKFISKKVPFNDEPKLFMSATIFFSEMFLNKLKKIDYLYLPKYNAIGFSFDKFQKISELKSKAEAIERFFQYLLDKRELINFSELNKKQKQITNNSFKEFFKENKFIENIPLVKGFFKKFDGNLEIVFIPYVFLFLNFLDKHEEKKLVCEPNTNGSSFGFTLQDALYRALYEAIERECVVNTFISNIGIFEINKFSKEVKNLIDYFYQYRLKIKVYQFKNHFGLYVVGVFIIDDFSDIFLTFGYKCGNDLNKTIIGALLEAFHSRISIKNSHKRFQIFKKEKIENISDSTFFFAKKNNGIKLLEKIEKIKNNTLKFKKEIKKNKKNINLEYFYYIFNQSLSKKNFFVVKVIVPDFNCFFLNQENLKKFFNFNKLKKYLDNNYNNADYIYKNIVDKKIDKLPTF